MDAKDLFLQPQSAQGTRIVRADESFMAVTDGTLSPADLAADYTASFAVLANDSALGTVKIDGVEVEEAQEYPAGTTLTLKAEAKSGATFVKWNNGSTEAEISVVTKGQFESYVAFFKKD